MKNNLSEPPAIFNAWKLIQQANKITLLTHIRPDGDGIAACAALEHVLIKFNKQVETIYPNLPEFDFKRQPKNILINTHRQIPDLIIMCDTATYARAYYPELFHGIPLINIDHHISNTITGTYNFVDTTYSSACEGLFLLLHAISHDLIDTYVAECLLSGILYDGLIFITQATTPQTLHIAAYLIERGANLYTLKTELIANQNPQVLALWGKVLHSVQVTSSKNALYTTVTQKDLKNFSVKQPHLSAFIAILSQLSTIDVTLLFYEMESGQTKVSLRSKSTDVNKLAAKFGGGGHINAAGFCSDKPIQEVIQRVINEFNNF